MFSSFAFTSRPFSSGAIPERSTTIIVPDGEYGWATWSYSRVGKLNAWAWHGLGTSGSANVNSWATLGNAVFIRRENDEAVHIIVPDTYIDSGDTNQESENVYAQTQWLDFGKPGVMKSVTGMDFDGENVTSIEVYVSAGGSRDGVLACTIDIADADDGWTYSGDVVPVDACGTEFMLRFVGDPDTDVKVNRFTLQFDEMKG